jgi:hypothetical protein
MVRKAAIASVLGVLAACGGDSGDAVDGTMDPAGDESEAGAGEGATDAGAVADLVPGITESAEVDVEGARANAFDGVFILPYVTCEQPLAGEAAGKGPDGKVCTPVSIAGATEPGRYFPDYASCDVVRTQRPFWVAPPAMEPSEDDPRLDDARFVAELEWVTEQVRATGCTCCHDATAHEGKAAQWDISRGPIWTDTVSDDGVALFTGLASSAVLGAYPPEENNGFDRESVGLPSTDPQRMRRFFIAELERRGITEEQASAVPPFGGPIYQNQIKKPGACGAGLGVSSDGAIHWSGGRARYVYILAEGSRNPGVPPNLDKPEGTLWRLDALPSAPAMTSGIRYGQTPKGTYQMLPEASAAPALQQGMTYQLFVELDMGFVIENCLFEYPVD